MGTNIYISFWSFHISFKGLKDHNISYLPDITLTIFAHFNMLFGKTESKLIGKLWSF